MPDMGNIRIKDENMNKTTIITNVQTRLFELQDLKYRDFHAKLMPTVNKEKIIGVRSRHFVYLRRSMEKRMKQKNICRYCHISTTKKIICTDF